MSGFIGVVNFDGEPVDKKLLEKLAERIACLGPDAQDCLIDGAAGFAHALFRTTRESATERQPLTIDDLTIVGDARIDARAELVCQLRSRGQEVSLGLPDINLILAAYRVWNQSCLQYLIGDFAFAIWDRRRRQVYCARDHFGIRPLYYAHVGSTLIVSNQIGAIRLHPKVTPTLNEGYIADFLLCGNQIWLDRTGSAFANIYRIPPAHQLICEGQITKMEPYWSLPTTGSMLKYHSENEYISHFMQLLNDAVKDRLRSERAAISMSGGLDSTSLAAVACQLVQSGDIEAKLTARTLVYDRIHPDHEAYYAALAARSIGIPIHISSYDHRLLKEPLPITSEPVFVMQSGASEEKVQETLSFGTVVLQGHGVDELLEETPLYQIVASLGLREGASLFLWLWRFLGHRPALGGVRRFANPLQWRYAPRTPPVEFPIWLNPDLVQRLDLRARWHEFWSWRPAQSHFLHPNAYKSTILPSRTLSGELLYPLGTVSPEAAAPFLDLRLVNYIMSLPPQPWFTRKYLLRRAMRNLLPAEILSRPKTILGSLLTSLLQQPGTEWIDEWEAIDELEAYVVRAAVPTIAGNPAEYSAAFVNLRPLFLNRWLLHRNSIYS